MEVSGQRTAQATLSSALIHTCGWVADYADLDTITGGEVHTTNQLPVSSKQNTVMPKKYKNNMSKYVIRTEYQ